ncbi:MAG: hypothetical protein EXR93_11540 [Gemmatimonadetes bacterium]|nr:hypothetical protein [Gemmatimonadota bacterium]
MKGRSLVASMLAGTQLACLAPMRRVELSHMDDGIGRVWVTRNDGARMEVHSPRIIQDSLFAGWAPDGITFIGFPVSEIQEVSMRGSALGRTLLLVGVVSGVVLITVFTVSGHSPDTQEIEEDFTVPRIPRVPD